MLLQQLNREYSQISCSIPEVVFKERIKKKFCPFDPFSSMKKVLGNGQINPYMLHCAVQEQEYRQILTV